MAVIRLAMKEAIVWAKITSLSHNTLPQRTLRPLEEKRGPNRHPLMLQLALRGQGTRMGRSEGCTTTALVSPQKAVFSLKTCCELPGERGRTIKHLWICLCTQSIGCWHPLMLKKGSTLLINTTYGLESLKYLQAFFQQANKQQRGCHLPFFWIPQY